MIRIPEIILCKNIINYEIMDFSPAIKIAPWSVPVRIASANWIIVAICKHIVTKISNAGGCITVRVDESANLGVIITALEIVEAGFGVVVIASVSHVG